MFFKTPGFALKILYQRSFFFLVRRLPYGLEDSYGYSIDTAPVLNSYWNMFVERGLCSAYWTSAFMKHPNPVAIDVGANAGVFSHLLVTLNPNVEITAFEPLPKMAARITSRIEERDLNIKLINCACSDNDGEHTFFMSSPDDTTATLEERLGGEKEKITVKTVTLDSVVEQNDIFLIKVDTEGHELSTLKGAKKTISRTSFLIIEAHDNEAFLVLKEFLGDGWSSEKLDPSNYLFSNKSKLLTYRV